MSYMKDYDAAGGPFSWWQGVFKEGEVTGSAAPAFPPLMTPQRESPSLPLIIVDCVHYVMFWYLGGAVGGFGAKWQLRVSLFLKANWTSVFRGKQREVGASLIQTPSSIVQCIFYELADPVRRRPRPEVVMLCEMSSTSTQKSPELCFNEINKPAKESGLRKEKKYLLHWHLTQQWAPLLT